MTAAEIVQELQPFGSESIKKVLLKHGIQEPLPGVKKEPSRVRHAMNGFVIALGTYVQPLTDHSPRMICATQRPAERVGFSRQ